MKFWWNSTGIPSEYCRRFFPNLPHVFQNYSDEIPLAFWQNEPEFSWNFCGILMEFLWYFLKFGWYFDRIFVVFSRIWLVFWWNFSGILMEFQSKKAMRKVLLAEFNRYFCWIFHVFSHLAIPQKSMGKALHCGNLTGILMEISLNLHY